MKTYNNTKVIIGLSGGVDSAVSAYLLKKQGYEVSAAYIQCWKEPGCRADQDRKDALKVALILGIPFQVLDFSREYKEKVLQYFYQEYKAGRTPNPDVMCNKEVKFGAFLKKAISMGADYVATGHYAQKKLTADSFQLIAGLDSSKDQVYFLWTLKQEQLSKILFPVGHLNKTEVRKLAKKFKLPVAEKKDSQGICFLGAVDLKEFLKHYIKEKKGKVVDENGDEIGYHNGVVFYTLGERHGFTIIKKSSNDKPYYVVGKDVKKNILYVSQDKNSKNFGAFALGDKRIGNPRRLKFLNFCLELRNTNWISKSYKLSAKSYKCQIRYHGELLKCKIKITGKTKAEVIFQKPILVASGQSCVIYDKDICLGGGVIV